MGVTVVAGVRGVGVSSVCTETRRELSDEFELINFGDVMLEQAAARGMAVERSALGALSTREIERLQRRAGEYVADRSSPELLVSTHLAVETADGLLPGLPDPVLQDVSPDRFVLIEAEPATIAARRSDERSTSRLSFQQDLSRSAAMEYAVQAGVPIERVENDAEPAAAADRLIDLLASR